MLAFEKSRLGAASSSTTSPSSSGSASSYRRFGHNSSTEDEDLNEAKESAYQVIIAISGVLSIASFLCLCLIVPSLYNYVQNVAAFSQKDFAYCDVSFFRFGCKVSPTGDLYIFSSPNGICRSVRVGEGWLSEFCIFFVYTGPTFCSISDLFL